MKRPRLIEEEGYKTLIEGTEPLEERNGLPVIKIGTYAGKFYCATAPRSILFDSLAMAVNVAIDCHRSTLWTALRIERGESMPNNFAQKFFLNDCKAILAKQEQVN